MNTVIAQIYPNRWVMFKTRQYKTQTSFPFRFVIHCNYLMINGAIIKDRYWDPVFLFRSIPDNIPLVEYDEIYQEFCYKL